MDLLVSDDQTISETMQILEEKGLLARKTAETVKYIKTLRADHQINVLLTYSEADIYFGDMLVLEKRSIKESIEFINGYIAELDSILVSNDGFHTEKVSEKIKLLQLMQESTNAFEETDISYKEAVQNLGQGETD